LTVSGPGGTNTATKTNYITVYDKPAVAFTATTATTGCNPLAVTFSSTVTLNSPGTPTYAWDFGDGNGGAGTGPTHIYSFPGTYPVSLTVTNGAGCTRTVTRTSYITVYDVPNGGFTATQTMFCSVPAAAAFTSTTVGGTTPYSIGWRFGDGGVGSGATPTHNYTTGGGFTVVMTVTDAHGCIDSVVAPAYISVNTTAPTFTAPTRICVDAVATFTNTTPGPGIGATSWEFDDGTTESGTTATHTFTSSGTYNVKMSTDVAGCVKTLTKAVIVDPKPQMNFAITPSVPCPATSTLTFTASTVPAAATYTWTWKSGGTASGQTVTKTYTSNIADEVKLVATTSNGCTDSLSTDTIKVRRILVNITPGGFCDPDPLAGCFPFTTTFGTELLSSLPAPMAPCAYGQYPLPAVSWFWDFGDGTPNSTSSSPTHTYLNVGDYIVKCRVTTSNGCTDSGSRRVHVDTPVAPSFFSTPLTVCTQTPVLFVNTTVKALVDTRYSFIIEDDTTITKEDTTYFYHKFKKPGTYTVRLNTNHRGCIDTFTRLSYIVVNPPGAKFTSNIHCSPSRTVDFTNVSINATSQTWLFGDGNTSPSFSPSHTYAATGTYTVTLIAFNSTYGCTDTFRANVTVFDPFIQFTATDTAICTGDRIAFQAAFTGSGVVRYSWIFGNIQTGYDTASRIDYQFTSKGYYDVSLVAISGNNCFDTLKKRRYVVVSRPTVNFGAYPPIGCEPLKVLFRDSSTNTPGIPDTVRRWVFGDGGTANAFKDTTTINYVYNNRGRWTVKLFVTDSLGCTDSLIKSNYVVVSKPNAAFTIVDDSVCAKAPVVFRNNSIAQLNPIKYLWNFGDGRTDTVKNPTHFYLNKGVYYVKLTVTDSIGCFDTLTLPTPVVVDAPTAAFTMSDSVAICPPLQVTFTNKSLDAVSYLWNFGTGGPPIVVPNPVTTFSTAGVYQVYLVATNINGCTDTARAQVRVLGYNGAFDYSPITGCAPLTVNFHTPLTGIPKISWVFGDGAIVTGSATSISHTYLTPGPYLPQVIFSDGAMCSSVSDGIDTIRVDKMDADFTWTVPCVGVAFTLNQQSTAMYQQPNSWYWVFGSGDTAVGSPVTHTFNTPGNHSVTLVAGSSSGCRDTITKDVFINDLPNIQTSKDTGVCPGDPVRLYVSGGTKYTWSPIPDSTHNPPANDTIYTHLNGPDPGEFKVFYVTGTDANGCVNNDSVRVSIKFKTDITTGQGGEICVGDTFRLHAQGADSYIWAPAETIDSPYIASPLATPQKTTTYIVAGRQGTCEIDTQYINVIVHSLPIFSAGPDQTIALGAAATLQPTKSGITKIAWTPDSTLHGCIDCFNPTANPYFTHTYYATAYNEWGCSVTDSVIVFIRCNGSLVYIPNTFSPNGDGKNDYFYPRGEGIERVSNFRVFNRWGQMVFERMNFELNDERAGWDGRFNGQQLPPDVYVYTMQSTCSTGEILKWKGDITLIK
jgi:gliding motility-associated-like protein